MLSGGEPLEGFAKILPKRVFGYSCSRVNAYLEEWGRKKEDELRTLRERIELSLKTQGELLQELSLLLGELASEWKASEQLLSELMGFVEQRVAAEEEARKDFEDALEARRKRLEELEARYEMLSGVVSVLSEAAAGLEPEEETRSHRDALGEGVLCSEDP